MTGRMENEKKIFDRLEIILKNTPDYLKDWYYNLRASQFTARTCYDYIYKTKGFLRSINPDISKITLDDITQSKVTSYIISTQTREKEGEIAYTSVAERLLIWHSLNNFFEYLEQNDLKPKNYMKGIAKPKKQVDETIESKRVLLTAKDFKKIVDAVESESNKTQRMRDKAIIMVFMSTGIRRTALSELLLSDYDSMTGTLVVVDKGNKKHEFILPPKTRIAMADWLFVRKNYAYSNENHLFVSRRGNEITDNAVNEVVKKYSKIALGKPVSTHKLRAGYCSILYKKTNDIEFVRRAVGHSNIATTQRYIVTKGEEKKKASEIMGSIF